MDDFDAYTFPILWMHFFYKTCFVLTTILSHLHSSITELISQHVMEHGKPHERSAIIEKLIGQIVQMSQQKFASNVIEKCLSFGNPVERQILIGEMLGSTEESEHLEVCCPSIC